MATPKQAAQQLIGQLPDQASWDDIMYELYVKQKIEAGLQAIAEGRTVPHEEVKRRLLDKKQRARRLSGPMSPRPISTTFTMTSRVMCRITPNSSPTS